MTVEMTRTSRIRSAVVVSGGNFLDMYDFMVFGYYVPWISKVFFPRQSEYASLLLTFAVFGAGFLMRPIGALVLGAYVDKHGRRSGLVLTLALMGLGTLSIACTPGYASLGLLSSLLVLFGRLLQGFAAGAQVGSASVYLSEIAPPGKKGLYVSWQSASQQLAVVFAVLVGILVNSTLSPHDFDQWGWRIPFFVGCLLIPFILLIRRSIEESPAFLVGTGNRSSRIIVSTIVRSWQVIGLGTMLVALTTVTFYLITAYSPTFGSVVLHLSTHDSLTVTLCVGVSNFILLPVMGSLSDRIGRRPLLLSCAIAILVTSYPSLAWLVSSPSFSRLLVVELWLSILYSGYNGAMIVFLTEIVPREVRAAGFSLAYSLATALFGGFTPAVSTYFIHATGNRAMPGVLLSAAAICAILATLVVDENLPVRERLMSAGHKAV